MVEAGTLATNADVEKYAGANCSAISKAEAYTNVYLVAAEAIIGAATRYDWVTNHASLDTEAQELLRQATATLAAVFVISYDMSGFTSRIEAENMININFKMYRDAMKLLDEQKTVKYLGGT